MSWRDRGRPIDRRRWARSRRAAFERDGWRCQACGQPGRLEAHHVRPLERGGAPYDLENISTRCRECHLAAHRRKRSPDEVAWKVLVDELLGSKPS